MHPESQFVSLTKIDYKIIKCNYSIIPFVSTFINGHTELQ